MNRFGQITVSFVFSVWLSACAIFQGGISYYDPTTYKSLTDLKPEVMFLYDSFHEDSVDRDWIWSIRLRLAQIYEYERGKGQNNEPTWKQIGEIRQMFERHVIDRLDSGPWSPTHSENRIENIAEAFDIAIETERLKNKNEPYR